MSSTDVQKQKPDSQRTTTHKSSSRRDRSEKDEAIVESVIAEAKLGVQEESILRKLLNYINENKLITFIIVILGLAVVFALFIKFTSTGQNLWNKTNTTKPVATDTGPKPNAAAHDVNQERATNNNQPQQQQQPPVSNQQQQPPVVNTSANASVKTQDKNNMQDKFEERLQFNINEAFSAAEKSQFVNSQTAMTKFVIKYLQETDLKYPATSEDVKKCLPYIITKIKARFPKLPETEDPDTDSDTSGSEEGSDEEGTEEGSDEEGSEEGSEAGSEVSDDELADEPADEPVDESEEESEPPKKTKKNKKDPEPEPEPEPEKEEVVSQPRRRRDVKKESQKKR